MAFPYDAQGADFADSMLSRKFGREVVNYFSGSPLNRLSFLRSSHPFLRAALPASKFLLLRDLEPLTASAAALSYVPYPTVAPLIGAPFDVDETKLIEAFDSRVETPTLVFLGIDEKVRGVFEYVGDGGTYSGQPYFALDVTAKAGSQAAAAAEKLAEQAASGEGVEFRKMRLETALVPPDAAIVAQARTLLDWNARNQFCAACGSRTISVHAGTKRLCPPTDAAAHSAPRTPCVSRTGVHNIAFPRTDPTVIMAVISSTHTHLLLGRQRRWPKDFYSTLAGFCEPAESLEDAVRRETWEESGVRVGRVVVHSTQPWPYPNSLMIGAVGEAVKGGEEIVLMHDPELEDARWFEIAVVKEALERARVGGGGLSEVPVGHKEGDMRLPPSTAIAHQILLAVVNGFHQLEAKI